MIFLGFFWDLTSRQRSVRNIGKYVAINHYPPSYREIGTMVGIASSSTLSENLNKMDENGYVSRGRPRTLKVNKIAL